MSQHENEPQRIGRRRFLEGAAALPLMYAVASPSRADDAVGSTPTNAPGAFPGVISRQTNPDNFEFPFPTLNGFLTPNEQFYVRTHFNVPDIDASKWRLSVEGHVERPFDLGYDELRRVEPRTVTSLLECSGNGRVFLDPPQVSIRWEQGAVGNAEWTGASLSTLLERAGVKRGAVEVILEGEDKGKFDKPNSPTPGEIHYARSLPLDKARQPDVLLAYRMNGADLPPAHGHPVRAVIPGWYGMASVKWLRRVIVTDRPFQGYFQTFAYAIWERRHGGLPTLVPVTAIDVKAQIARPALHEVVPAATDYRIFGAAWAGESEIAKVEISADGGTRWEPANLDEHSIPNAWRFFQYTWRTPAKPGKVTLMARAADVKGRVQPLERDPDRRDAVISHVQRIEVSVR